ncbi:hypothetical protein K457DRAFT_209966 [Linnemannia elongata AG-77]|uniref:Uncharacterized protein n=1 Tax=Linnemannia elongata AG-77 TaxID=1314771 RepID=A0A197JE85_9FUNG|nr:hypothetical protein K457DRAFT_209966 [Linnemannia elongata AG-77]
MQNKKDKRGLFSSKSSLWYFHVSSFLSLFLTQPHIFTSIVFYSCPLILFLLQHNNCHGKILTFLQEREMINGRYSL